MSLSHDHAVAAAVAAASQCSSSPSESMDTYSVSSLSSSPELINGSDIIAASSAASINKLDGAFELVHINTAAGVATAAAAAGTGGAAAFGNQVRQRSLASPLANSNINGTYINFHTFNVGRTVTDEIISPTSATSSSSTASSTYSASSSPPTPHHQQQLHARHSTAAISSNMNSCNDNRNSDTTSLVHNSSKCNLSDSDSSPSTNHQSPHRSDALNILAVQTTNQQKQQVLQHQARSPTETASWRAFRQQFLTADNRAQDSKTTGPSLAQRNSCPNVPSSLSCCRLRILLPFLAGMAASCILFLVLLSSPRNRLRLMFGLVELSPEANQIKQQHEISFQRTMVATTSTVQEDTLLAVTGNDSPTQVPLVHASGSRAHLPLCPSDDYGDGEWIFDATVTEAPYISNEWDNVCDKQQNKEETVVTVTATVANGTVSTPSPPSTPLRPSLQYLWQPRHCRLAGPYSRASMCHLLAGRNILFVGDSIAGQHVSSFIHLLYDTAQQQHNKLWIRDEFFREDMLTVCQEFYPIIEKPAFEQLQRERGNSSNSKGSFESHLNADYSPPPWPWQSNPASKPLAGYHPHTGAPMAGLRVGFRRNNFLSLHADSKSDENIEQRKWDTNQSWVGLVKKHQFGIVIMNTGIWVIDAPLYTSLLMSIKSHIDTHYPDVLFLWRSTQPGHAYCHEHWSRPQSHLQSAADTAGGSAKFRWEEAPERNRIAQRIFAREYLDVFNMTVLRPDGHMPTECLHYCQPGPVDEWQKVLYHRLAWEGKKN